MLKKCILVLALGMSISAAGLVLGQSRAYACSNGVCGYFKNQNDRADCNVLPDTSIRWGAAGGDTWYPDYCWLNFNWGEGHSRLYGVNNANSFINDISAYLNENTGTGAFIQNSQAGGAFLVDYMLGIDRNNGSTGNGINDARAQFGNWSNTIRMLSNGGANECATNSGQMTCPGKPFGINWKYIPPYFCTNPVNTSAYDPHGAYDTPIYWTGANSCDHDWSASAPEIVFYWNNGANSFHIGSKCGNAQSRADKLPPVNHLPEGSISITCVDPNTGLQSAHVTFRDQDAATIGHFTVGAQPYGPYTSSGPGAWFTQDINLILPPTTDAYNKQTVTLYVKDTGPVGDQLDHQLSVVQTASPCVVYGCAGPTIDPIRLDPYMAYSLTVGIKPSVGQLPPNPTVDIQSIVTPGGATYYTHGQVAATNNGGVLGNTFTNVPKTNGTGVFTANWRLYSNGSLLKSCSGTFSVINLPYLNVYGGDVMSGAAPAAGGACSVNNAAGVYSWSQYGSGYAGAGSEYAVQALAQIEEFGSAMNPSSGNPPTDLSFANSAIAVGKVNPAQGLFGGFFGDSSGAWACGVDYTKGLGSPISGATATIQIANMAPAGTSPAQIGDGQRLRMYANGDVYISRNITYQNGSWPKVDQIPVFELVVTGGNIYIDSSVTQLDGIYVAEPSGAAGGQIIDCATNGGGIWKQVDPTVNNFYSTCNKKLTINGVFVAKQTLFGRTNGSLGQAAVGDNLSTNHDAEVFNYTPEIWLPRSATTPTDTYDAITALPPIL